MAGEAKNTTSATGVVSGTFAIEGGETIDGGSVIMSLVTGAGTTAGRAISTAGNGGDGCTKGVCAAAPADGGGGGGGGAKVGVTVNTGVFTAGGGGGGKSGLCATVGAATGGTLWRLVPHSPQNAAPARIV